MFGTARSRGIHEWSTFDARSQRKRIALRPRGARRGFARLRARHDASSAACGFARLRAQRVLLVARYVRGVVGCVRCSASRRIPGASPRGAIKEEAGGFPASHDAIACMEARLRACALALFASWHHAIGSSPYGRRPMPPSSVMVSPLMNLKSGLASCTTTRPISASTSP